MGYTIGVVKRYGPTEVKARVVMAGISFTNSLTSPDVESDTSEREGEDTLPRRNRRPRGRKRQIDTVGRTPPKRKPKQRNKKGIPPSPPEAAGPDLWTTGPTGGVPKPKHTTQVGGDAA